MDALAAAAQPRRYGRGMLVGLRSRVCPVRIHIWIYLNREVVTRYYSTLSLVKGPRGLDGG
jgi:hypothetical protein